jgi:16S rRNA processing protein RimM
VFSSTSSTDFLEAGRVGRQHGLDGSFHVTRPRAELLGAGGAVRVAGTMRRIARRSGTDERPILRLDGCADRDAALALRGQPLLVARADAPALGEDEWWPEELVGCAVRDGERVVGTVGGVSALPSCDALEVERDGGTLLIPLVRDAVRSVDVAGRTIDVNMGFVEG